MPDQKFDSESFDAGWAAAIEEVSAAVAGYIELQKRDDPDLGPWEVWLPNFLKNLSKSDTEKP